MADTSYIREMIIMEKGKPTKLVPILVSKDEGKTLARAYLTSDQAINHNTATPVTGYTESLDAGGSFNPTTGIYTAFVAGKYHIDYSVLYYDAQSKLTLCAARILDGNGALLSEGSAWSGTDMVYAGSSGSDIIEMAAGDTLKLVGFMTTSDSSAAVMQGGIYTKLAVHLIST